MNACRRSAWREDATASTVHVEGSIQRVERPQRQSPRLANYWQTQHLTPSIWPLIGSQIQNLITLQILPDVVPLRVKAVTTPRIVVMIGSQRDENMKRLSPAVALCLVGHPIPRLAPSSRVPVSCCQTRTSSSSAVESNLTRGTKARLRNHHDSTTDNLAPLPHKGIGRLLFCTSGRVPLPPHVLLWARLRPRV
eukprot:4693714-Amphidinium_carterae.2